MGRPRTKTNVPEAGGAATTSPKSPPPRTEVPKEPGTAELASRSATPAMRQYLEQKARVGDAILLFRIGDFYETFYDDARTIARVLGLTLTARDKNSENPVPLAGVPYHAADRYIARLVKAGYKVAVSEQIEDAASAKGVVRRDVVRILTPGTLTDEALLDERSDNRLVALMPDSGSWATGKIGLACVSIASGEFFAQMVEAGALIDELARLGVAEVLVSEPPIDQRVPELEMIKEALAVPLTHRPPNSFDPHFAQRNLCEHFKVASLSGFGFDSFDASLCSAAALLNYLRETQKTALTHLLKITPRIATNTVMVDVATLRSLEVERTFRDGAREGSLLAAIDHTRNPMGARRLRQWLCFPLANSALIRRRQDAIAAFVDEPGRIKQLQSLLAEMGDIERIISRVGVGRATPRDLAGLARSLELCQDAAVVIGPPVNAQAGNDLLNEVCSSLSGHEALAKRLAEALVSDAPPTLRDGGFIASGFNAELDRLRAIGHDGRQFLAEYQAQQAARTGIATLKIGYNSVFGYYIEITHQHRDKVPPEYVRKQTVRNAERYITDELKRYENEVLGAADRARHLEIELFEALRQDVAANLAQLTTTSDAVATLDVLVGLADLARRRDYCRPELIDPSASATGEGKQHRLLEIVDGRHPVLDLTLQERFVPNDCRLASDSDQLCLLTGPNMAGKSTYIRQVALLTLLAHTGSFVPAKSMRWTPVDRIFARVGAADELARGQSTFMVEMVESARILNNATSRSLVILDEIGRGTSTYDGLAIAWAVTEYLVERVGCLGLFATHYHELTELAKRLSGIANFNVAVREQLRPDGAARDIVFLHKILPGATDRSYGIHVAAMAGLPRSVVQRSEEVLAALDRNFESKSERSGMAHHDRQPPDQLLLFADGPTIPAGLAEVADQLAAIDTDRITPLESLALLSKLRALLAGDQPRI